MNNTAYNNKTFQQDILTIKLTAQDTQSNLILVSKLSAFLQTNFPPKSFSSIFRQNGVYYCYLNISIDTLEDKLQEIQP